MDIARARAQITDMPGDHAPRPNDRLAALRRGWSTALRRIEQRVPPGLRVVVGLLLVVGGVFGMLPVLGFWMIPLGIAVAALDVRPFVRAILRGIGRGR